MTNADFLEQNLNSIRIGGAAFYKNEIDGTCFTKIIKINYI